MGKLKIKIKFIDKYFSCIGHSAQVTASTAFSCLFFSPSSTLLALCSPLARATGDLSYKANYI